MLQKKTKLMLMKTRVMIVMQRRSMAISRPNCLRKRKKLKQMLKLMLKLLLKTMKKQMPKQMPKLIQKLIQKLLRIQRHKKKNLRNLSLPLILLCLMRRSMMTMKQM